MNEFQTAVLNVIKWVNPIGLAAVVAALAVCGVIMIVAGEEGQAKAKKWIPRIAIGGIIFELALILAQQFFSVI